MTKSKNDKCVGNVKRCALSGRLRNNFFRNWLAKYAPICICLTVLCGIIMAYWIGYLLLEIQYFINNSIKWFLATIRYITLISIVAASFYAFLRLNILKSLTRKDRKKKELACFEKNESESTMDYSVSILREPAKNSFPAWEKTVEDCWYNLNIASVRLKTSKETIATNAIESKAKLREITSNLLKLEEMVNEERGLTTDTASNTDLLFDYRLRAGVDILPVTQGSASESSVSSQMSTDTITSRGTKYNILERVIEMGDNLSFDPNAKPVKRSKSKKYCIPRPVETPRIPPIQQWSMPREIFSFSSVSSFASRY